MSNYDYVIAVPQLYLFSFIFTCLVTYVVSLWEREVKRGKANNYIATIFSGLASWIYMYWTLGSLFNGDPNGCELVFVYINVFLMGVIAINMIYFYGRDAFQSIQN